MINKTYPISEKLLKNGLRLSLSLLELLTQESDSLKTQPKPEILSNIVTHKKEAVSQLDQFSNQLAQVLATEKLQMTSQGIADYFIKAASENIDTHHSKNLWRQILTITQQNRLLNQKNGASINLLAQHTQRSLQILKGKSQQITTYGADGSTYSERFSQPLFSA